MPPKKTNTFPLRTGDECGRTETLRVSISPGPLSLASRITPIEWHSPKGWHWWSYCPRTPNWQRDRWFRNQQWREWRQPRCWSTCPHASEYPSAHVVEKAVSYGGMTGENEQIPLPTEYRTTILTWMYKQNPNFNMANPRQYCGSAPELDMFPGSLRSTFRTDRHLFSDSDTDKVQYAPNHLGSWSNPRDDTLHTTSAINPITGGQDLLTNDSPCLHDFDHCICKIQKKYGDKGHGLHVGTRLYLQFRQGYHDPVRVYKHMLTDYDTTGKMLAGMRSSGSYCATISSGRASNPNYTQQGSPCPIRMGCSTALTSYLIEQQM